MGERPVVSVVCATFEHRPFIEDALKGFLGQETDFPFEVIVRDDASRDGTAEIVADFAQRYPNIVRSILETENRYPAVKPGNLLRRMARGSFIAPCEGDDYWTDPRKLQVQRDGLVADVAAVASHHRVAVIEHGVVVRPEKRARRQCRDASARQLARGARVLTSSLMYRNVPLLEASDPSIGVDLWLRARLGLVGSARWEPDLLPSVHRLHPGGVWSSQGEGARARTQMRHLSGFALEFRTAGHPQLAGYYRRRAVLLRTYAALVGLHPALARAAARLREGAFGA